MYAINLMRINSYAVQRSVIHDFYSTFGLNQMHEGNGEMCRRFTTQLNDKKNPEIMRND